ncbi:hypothetical protein ACJX0J_009313, partial [Zea mays]
ADTAVTVSLLDNRDLINYSYIQTISILFTFAGNKILKVVFFLCDCQYGITELIPLMFSIEQDDGRLGVSHLLWAFVVEIPRDSLGGGPKHANNIMEILGSVLGFEVHYGVLGFIALGFFWFWYLKKKPLHKGRYMYHFYKRMVN